jgi:hypothetical protein
LKSQSFSGAAAAEQGPEVGVRQASIGVMGESRLVAVCDGDAEVEVSINKSK